MITKTLKHLVFLNSLYMIPNDPYKAPGSLKGTLLGTLNREPQEYDRNIMKYEDPGRHIPIIFHYVLGVPCLGFPIQSLYLLEPPGLRNSHIQRLRALGQGARTLHGLGFKV